MNSSKANIAIHAADTIEMDIANDGTLTALAQTDAPVRKQVVPPPAAKDDTRPAENLTTDTPLSDDARQRILATIPRPLRLAVPATVDDSNDPMAVENQLTPDQRERLGLPKMRVAPKGVPIRLLPDKLDETALRIAESVAGTADLVPVLEPVTEEEGDDTRTLTSFEPKLRVRVQAVVCRNSDGRMSNGDFGQTREQLGPALATAIAAANTILATSNIELVFYPSSDLDIRNSTSLNQDFILPASALAQLKKSPPLTRAEVEALTNQYATTTPRNALSAQYPNKLILLFAEGTTAAQGRDLFGQAGDIPVPADYDGDGRADVAVWRPSNGKWFTMSSRHGGYRERQWGQNGDKPVPADYDGDGRADFAVWRPSDGKWYIINSSDNSIRTEALGQNGDIPVPGRYDSDSYADFAVWRPSNGTWFIKNSRTGATRTVQWGQVGDIPVPADYDGDGITDLAVWRPSDGKWYIIQSSNNATKVVHWGVPGDRPIPGDYYGDGKADCAVFRPLEGNWYLLNSTTNASQVIRFGEANDVVVPADYNGDRLIDISVWRPSNGQWYIDESGSGNNRWDDWTVVSPSGGGFSSGELKFVKLSGGINPDPNDYGQAAFIAHEVGHYLHLDHTHGNYVGLAEGEGGNMTNAQKAELLKGKIITELNRGLDRGVPNGNLVNGVFDGDSNTVSDTPADPGPEYFVFANNANACGSIGSLTVTVQNGQSKTIAPDRSLVMSYFKGCTNFPNRYSTQQAERMRNALMSGNRHDLVKVQLGETAYPGEIVAAVWNPSTNGQYLSYGHDFNTFNTLYNQRVAQGFRLASQQAYTKNGVTLYDHIWNPGDFPQDVIWGWTVADFSSRHTQNVAAGYHLAHLESYLMPDNQVRVNAIWNKAWGSMPTTWVQGWAEADLNTKLAQMKSAGWRVMHINAWTLPNNGGVRYDAVWEQAAWHDEFVRLNMTGAQVVAEFGTQWARNFKFRTLDTFRVGNEQRYMGVWNPNTAGQLVLWGHTREQIDQQFDESWQQGWKLGSMAMVKF